MEIKINETQRRPIDYNYEKKLACAVVIDTSGSMADYTEELNRCVSWLFDEIKSDGTANACVELSIITFDDEVTEQVAFGPVEGAEIPRIDCGGMTRTHAAIDFAIQRIEARKEEYKRAKLDYYRPWIWLLTDGGSNDPDNGAFDRLLEWQRENRGLFFGFAIGENAIKEEIAGMNVNGSVLTTDMEHLPSLFEFVGSTTVNYGVYYRPEYRNYSPKDFKISPESGIHCEQFGNIDPFA